MYITLTNQRYILQRFLSYSGLYIYPDDKEIEDETYYDICHKHLDETLKEFLMKIAILFASVVAAVSMPTYKFISKGTKTTALQAQVPFTDENSDAEFTCNFILQFVIAVHGGLGYIGLEVGTTMCSDFISVSRKLLAYKLKRLDTLYKNGDLNESQMILEVRNIVQHIRDYDKYEFPIGTIKSIFNYTFVFV